MNCYNYWLVFRYRANVSGNPITLGAGDVALYTGLNYTGAVFVLRASSPVISNFVLVAGLDKAIQSVQFGPTGGAPAVGVVGYTNTTAARPAPSRTTSRILPPARIRGRGARRADVVDRDLFLSQFIANTHSCRYRDLRQFPFQQGGV